MIKEEFICVRSWGTLRPMCLEKDLKKLLKKHDPEDRMRQES